MVMFGRRPAAVTAELGAAMAIVGVLTAAACLSPDVKGEPESSPLSGDTARLGYRLVLSQTTTAEHTADGGPAARLLEIVDDGTNRRIRTGDADASVDSIQTEIRTPSGHDTYYPDRNLLKHVDSDASVSFWDNPSNGQVGQPVATVAGSMHGDRESGGWAEVQSFIDQGKLLYLGEDQIAGQPVRGARLSSGDGRITDAWFTVPTGLRVKTRTQSGESLEFDEVATDIDLGASLYDADFAVVSPTVWTTITLSTEVLQPGGNVVVNDYLVAALSSSPQFTSERLFSVERGLAGIGSYEYGDWSGSSVDVDEQLIGWMVVQDLIDSQSRQIRVLQNDGEANIPFGSVPWWPSYYGNFQTDTSGAASVTVAQSSNPVLRDPENPSFASWRDEDEGGQFLFIGIGFTAPDSELQDLVNALRASRPY